VEWELFEFVQPKIYSASDHDINLDLIDSDALTVIAKLQHAGHVAYLVGGSVRDLLIGKSPKDFDVSTSAKPEEIKHLFRKQCILIGRRFRLAHIRFGRKVIEVSTFRAGDPAESDLIVRDNRWGNPEEDVLRRDFTVNGLFFDPATTSVIDFVGGWEDIQDGILRTIGTPEIRFKQDPVRMLRALKFRARFDFDLEPETERLIRICYKEIAKSSAPRLLEEMFKMLESSASAPFFRLMTEYKLLEVIFPDLTYFLKGAYGENVYRYLKTADNAHNFHGNYRLERSILVACLLFPILEREIQTQFLDKGESPHLGNIIMLTSSIIKSIITCALPHFPRRIANAVSFILSTQYRFTPLAGKKHYRPALFHDKEFPSALRFLKLRSQVHPELVETYLDWKKRYYRIKRQHEKKHHPAPHAVQH